MNLHIVILALFFLPRFSLAQQRPLIYATTIIEGNDYCPDSVIEDRHASSDIQCRHFCGRQPECRRLYIAQLLDGQVRCLIMNSFIECTQPQPLQGSGLYLNLKYMPVVVLGQYCMGNRDERFAPFTFIANSGNYQLRLLHVNGSLLCSPGDIGPSRWGCDHLYFGTPSSKMTAVTDDYRGVVVSKSDFDEDDGRGGLSSYIATSYCFQFQDKYNYRVYHQQDLDGGNSELNNSGSMCMTVIVDPSACPN